MDWVALRRLLKIHLQNKNNFISFIFIKYQFIFLQNHMTKKDLITDAQKLCNTSFNTVSIFFPENWNYSL